MSKKKTKHGIKTRAGQLLSQFLRQIAEEKTEFVKDDGEDRMATKAEALARKMWKMALGYTETKIEDDGSEIKIYHSPDRTLMSMLFDRIEGRAPLSTNLDKHKRTIAEKVSEQGRERIQKAGDLDVTS